MKNTLFLFLALFIFSKAFSQDDYLNKDSLAGITYFINKDFYEPVDIDVSNLDQVKKPKNVILFIGDGMGSAHVFAALTANKGKLNINYFKTAGFSKTSSFSDFITDSGAGGTAISTGQKTYNKAIAVDKDSLPIKTILEILEDEKFNTGLIATACITHATPASFIAHNKYRYNYEEIALSFLKNDPEVLIGGGKNHFTKRKDGRNLLNDFQKRNYQVTFSLDEPVKSKKFICLVDTVHLPKVEERGDFLQKATELALNHLSKQNNGFFLMIEGSQIDFGGHDKDLPYIITETLDMDKAIGVALEFAQENGETLIIVTADHETGGLSILNGNTQTGEVWGAFASDDHTGLMVPVFAIGPGSEKFNGIFENTNIFYTILEALEIQIDKNK